MAVLSDAQHGLLGGGGHAVATASAHGMVSAADKIRMDAIDIDSIDDEVFVAGPLITTDATVTTLYTYAMPASSVVDIWVELLAFGLSGPTGAAFYRIGTFKRSGSTVSQCGTTQSVVSDNETNALTSMSFATSGTNVLVRVTGIAGVSLSWWVRGQVLKSSWA